MNELNNRINSFYPGYIHQVHAKGFDRDYREKIKGNLVDKAFKQWLKKHGVHSLMNVPPMFYPPFRAQKILSIGLNPSLTIEFFKSLPIKTNIGSYADKQVDELVEFQKRLKFGAEQIEYFRQQHIFFRDLDDKLQIEEEVFHYDLMQMRHTNAKGALRLFEDKHDKRLRANAVADLKFVVDSLQPKIIFVFNAAVARLFSENSDELYSKYDSKNGCYDFAGIPLILANQLSGGATSRVFRELLLWNSRRIYSELSERE